MKKSTEKDPKKTFNSTPTTTEETEHKSRKEEMNTSYIDSEIFPRSNNPVS